MDQMLEHILKVCLVGQMAANIRTKIHLYCERKGSTMRPSLTLLSLSFFCTALSSFCTFEILDCCLEAVATLVGTKLLPRWSSYVTMFISVLTVTAIDRIDYKILFCRLLILVGLCT